MLILAGNPLFDTKMRHIVCIVILIALCWSIAQAQPVDQDRGFDQRVDYAALKQIGPWDDRNYDLSLDDLSFLGSNEQIVAIPAFFRVLIRQSTPNIDRSYDVQYPRVITEVFRQEFGGFLIDGQLYTESTFRDGAYEVLLGNGKSFTAFEQAKLMAFSEVRLSSPNDAAESAVSINPVDTDIVLAGSNGPGGGQIMHYSTDGGATWTQSAPLPQGGTCCDPTIGWSSDGTKAYTSSLGNCGFGGCSLWFYRSDDNGLTWNGLENVTPGDPRRELTSSGISDKEYLHVDTFPTSPYKDNIYLSWHDNNVLQFSRSTDFGNTWGASLAMSSGSGERGIGSDVVSDKDGNVYFFWPATRTSGGNVPQILVRKSTDGGVSFAPTVEVVQTQDGFDFAIPSMESRRVFIYVSADVDYSNGPFGNSIYAAWTDNNGPEQGSAANNHSRIQVGYSRDGGATWNVTTPHETADILTVDRWHQWLDVDAVGNVHVVFYDTRNDPTRASVDFYHSVSTDGAVTWSTPERISGTTSANILDFFEFGDYNGMDIVMEKLIAVWTDNRDENGGSAESVDIYAGATTVDLDIKIDPMVFLHGPYDTVADAMTTNLSGVIPTAHPYNQAPWNHTGTEVADPMPADVTDWVLVQLRTGLDSTSTVATQAALLMRDGHIRSFDGTSPLSFSGVPANAYYLVVRHRSHLDVMSSVAVMLSGALNTYDFTSASGQVIGTNAMFLMESAPDVYGLWGGDGNATGATTAFDILNIFLSQNGTNGYLSGDFNLSGGVTAFDMLQVWLVGNGQAVQFHD